MYNLLPILDKLLIVTLRWFDSCAIHKHKIDCLLWIIKYNLVNEKFGYKNMFMILIGSVVALTLTHTAEILGLVALANEPGSVKACFFCHSKIVVDFYVICKTGSILKPISS